MFSKYKIRGWLMICLTGVVTTLMVFDACTAGGFLRRFIGCRTAPVRSCQVTYVTSSSCPDSYAPVNNCATTVTYSQPVYECSTTGIVYERPIQEVTGYPAPTCHDCSVTACDGMCGDYSDVCGGGGEVISECDGVIDFGYSDCCGNQSSVDGGYVYEETHTDAHTVERHSEGDVIQYDDYAQYDGYEAVEDGQIVTEEWDSHGSVVEDRSDVDVVDHDERLDGYRHENLDGSAMDSGDANPAVDDYYQPESALPEVAPSDVNTPPAPEPETEVSDDLADDLFGNGESTPREAPASESTDDLDTLFGGESTETPDAAMPPQEDIDDLFDDGPASAEPAPSQPVQDRVDEDLNELFGEPAADNDAAGTDDLESLFNENGASEADPTDDLDSLFETDSDKEAGAGDVESDLDALFGQSHDADVPDEATHTISYVSRVMPYRTWWDNTGNYQTIGRLMTIGDGHVRLLKSNGRTCVVTFDRLSDADIDYVKSQVEQYERSLKVARK